MPTATETKHFVEETGRCELCGSRRNLQLHHMIPLACENGLVNLDVEDNWVCVCGACHAKLTPKNLLVKYGISKRKLKNAEIINGALRRFAFIHAVEVELFDGIRLSPVEILDIFEAVYGGVGPVDYKRWKEQLQKNLEAAVAAGTYQGPWYSDVKAWVEGE